MPVRCVRNGNEGKPSERLEKTMNVQRFGMRLAAVGVLLLVAIAAFGLARYQSQLVQRVNVSKQTFGVCRLGNAAASNDSKGQVGGQITISCPGAPTSPAAVTMFDLSPDGSAWIAFGGRKNADGSPKDTISIEGTYDADASTERLIQPKIVGLKINGNAVVPSGN